MGRRRRITRRRFLEGTGVALVAATGGPLIDAKSLEVPFSAPVPHVPSTKIRLTVNSIQHEVIVEDRWTLVELLRDHLDLTGTKIGCDRGECGACTVLLDGKSTMACSILAVWADNRDVITVEGLARGTELHPLQNAFVEHDGPQCGFCTSGQLMSAVALLTHNPKPSSDEVRAALAGNICRCGNYNRYVEGVLAAVRTSKDSKHTDDAGNNRKEPPKAIHVDPGEK